jgi:D-alanyl-D-alanine carboxypeptidase
MNVSAKRFVLSAVCVWASLHSPVQAESLEERLKPLIDGHAGQVAVAVRHLEKPESFEHRADEPMPTASLIKFPVMIEAYRQAREGQIDLARMVALREEDKVPGSGILTTHFSAGASFSVRDSIRLMIAYSDNTATNLVLDQIGLAATAKYMEELGCPNTKIHSKVFKRETSVFPERSKQFGLGSTTAAEMLRLLAMLHQKKLVSPEASDAMREHLLKCDDRKKFPKLLPETVKVAHKSGSVDDIRTDAGIIDTPAGPIALCVLTRDNKDRRWADDNAGDMLCARIALAVYEHFNPPGPASEKKTSATRFRSGTRESSDGSGSRAEFSRISLLRGEAWVSGGGNDEEELSDARPDAPLPELAPRDSLAGPPFVTSRAWAVVDAKTGKLLGESQAADVVDVASTTKIMTAYLILRLAGERPALLNEMIEFSSRADKTDGSSCGLRAGERISVRELLYGLLVRSGNDAAIALAEHFGGHFDAPPGRSSESDPVARFVAEMNRAAVSLKLTETRYRNPHGLPEKGHVSSARDLAKLTHAARQMPLFCDYVATRQHETLVTARDGSQRPIVWKTTNRLLSIAGYTGVKTGYTKAAGSCLVSTGERGRDSLIVVVLGAPTAASAVVDSRNLYRWAWRERGHRE